VTSRSRLPRIPARAVLARALHPPVEDRWFWAIQAMVVVLAVLHLLGDIHNSLDRGGVPTAAPVGLLLVPVGFAALRYGLSGSAATAVWAVLLCLSALAITGGRDSPANDMVVLALIVGVAVFVGIHIEREHLERARAEAAEQDRHAAELRYRQLFDTNASPILLVDPTGVVIEANPAAAAALGGVTVGSGTEGLLGIGSEDLAVSRSPRIVRLRDEGGEERDFRLSVSHLGPAGDGALSQVVLDDVTEEHRAGAEARAWARELLRAQEEERHRIAQDIHDDTLQRLLQLARRMEALASPPCSREEAERIGTARRELVDVAARLRNNIRGLRPPGLDQLGLAAALRGLLVDFEDEEGLTAELEVTGDLVSGAPEAELGVFRIVQEAVRNVARHAGATRLSVALAYGEGAVGVRITDDGRGFDPAGVGSVPESHLGLLGMRERASLLGGCLEVHSARGGGTVVEATVPLGALRGRRGSAAGAAPRPPELEEIRSSRASAPAPPVPNERSPRRR
jgi:signal transduction histidine kinase